MRAFEDKNGLRWEVVAGRESWGAIFAIFIPSEGGPGLRQAPLRASSYEEANGELEALDESGLQALLEGAEPKDTGQDR